MSVDPHYAALTRKRVDAERATPEGFKLVGWLHDGKLYSDPLSSALAYPVYMQLNDGLEDRPEENPPPQR